jgi:hypothetical protein
MLTQDQLRSLDISNPGDQAAAYEYIRALSPEYLAELEAAFANFGGEIATKLLTSTIEAGCSDDDENERLVAAMLVAAYCHVLRTHRRLAN